MTPGVLDRMRTPIAELDASGDIRWTNSAFAALLAPIEATGPIAEHFPSLDWNAVRTELAHGACVRTLVRDGALFSARLSQSAGAVLVELLERSNPTDLHDSIQSERLLAALDQSGDVILVTDDEPRIVYVNPEFERVMGYSREDVLGERAEMWRSGLHDESFSEEARARIGKGETWRRELKNRRRDGSVVHEEISISQIRSGAGDVLGYVEIKRDRTNERELEQALAHAQRMESVGTLAGGVALDFDNVLRTIVGKAERLIEVDAMDPESRELLEQIRDAADHSSGLIHQLRAFSRQKALAPRAVETNVEVDRSLELIGRLIGENIELRRDSGSDIWPVRIAPAQLGQLVTNVCINAREALEGSGTILVRTRNRAAGDAASSAGAPELPGDYVEIEIRDDGPGMPPDVRERMFEPFFTTKSAAEGSGLGLSTVYGILVQNDGRVAVDTAPGEGTAVRLLLPRHVDELDEEPINLQATSERAGPAKVLVVEDEQPILRILESTLGNAGYEVFTCTDPEVGVTQAHALKRLDLVISDLVMPRMNGRALVDRIREVHPQVSVIYMSGFAADVLAGIELGDDAFIAKPFRRADLLARIEDLLESRK